MIHEGYGTDALLNKTFFIVAEKISFPKLHLRWWFRFWIR